jgi:lipopolysaccharide transport system permease protein
MMSSPSNLRHASVAASTIIKGTDSSFDLGWADLLRRRDLLYFLIWRDIKVRYKQTLLGVAWAILQPLLIAMSLTLFLARVVKVPTGGLPYPVFAYSGMVIWQFLAQSVTEASNSLVANERLISKVYFPRLVIPLSSVLASLMDLAVSLVVLTVFLIYFRIAPKLSLAVLPLMIALAGAVASGAGFWLSALNVKYRDVRYTVGFLVQFWFFVTPIAYPSSVVPDRWRLWYEMNPMVGAVEGFQWALRGTGNFPARPVILSAVVAAALFFSGLYYFRRTEDTFADFI